MKDLLQCWWLRLEKFFKISLIISAVLTPLLVLAMIFISPETRGEIFKTGREFTIYTDWLTFLIRVGGVLLIFLLVINLISGTSLIDIIRFKKTFFFLPPSTQEGMNALQFNVDIILLKFAECLQKSYKREEEILSILIRPYFESVPDSVLAQEKDLRNLRGQIKKDKKNFYSNRNLAKFIGFSTQESYKKYLEV